MGMNNPIIQSLQPGIPSHLWCAFKSSIYLHTSSDEEVVDDPGEEVLSINQHVTEHNEHQELDSIANLSANLDSVNPIIQALQPGIPSLVCIQMEYYHSASDEEEEVEGIIDVSGEVFDINEHETEQIEQGRGKEHQELEHEGVSFENPPSPTGVLVQEPSYAYKSKPEETSVKRVNSTEELLAKVTAALISEFEEDNERKGEKICHKLEEDKAERRRKLGLPAEDPTIVKPTIPVVQEKSSLLVMPATKVERMRECLQSLKHNHKDDDAKVKRAFQTLLTCVGEVIKKPDEELSRKIQLTNQSFQDTVGSLTGGVEFLESCGF